MIIQRSLGSAKIPCPDGRSRSSDGKRPDGASIVPWGVGKVLVWNVTCLDTLATSYSAVAAREAVAVASKAERRKKAKYIHLEPSHYFVPIAVEKCVWL